MGGMSGSRTASHTPILLQQGCRFAVSPAKMALVKRALAAGGALFVCRARSRED